MRKILFNVQTVIVNLIRGLYCSMTVEGVELFKLFLYVKNGHTLIEGGYYRHVRYLIGRPGLRPHPTILLEKNQRAIKFQ